MQWLPRNNTKIEDSLLARGSVRISGVQSNVAKITKSPFSKIKSLKVPNSGGLMDPPATPLKEPLMTPPGVYAL